MPATKTFSRKPRQPKNKRSDFVEVLALPGSIIVTPKEIKALKKHGIDLRTSVRRIQTEINGRPSRNW